MKGLVALCGPECAPHCCQGEKEDTTTLDETAHNFVHLIVDSPYGSTGVTKDELKKEAADLMLKIQEMREQNKALRDTMYATRSVSKHRRSMMKVMHDGGFDMGSMSSADSSEAGAATEDLATHRRASVRHHHTTIVDEDMNVEVLEGSALTKSLAVQVVIYGLAFGVFVFVLAAKATGLGEKKGYEDAAHRRLGGEVNPMMEKISYCVALSSLFAFALHFVKQPMMLGYLMSGVILGPDLLDIVHSPVDIGEVSELGTIFLLFMIGLELDLGEILKMGRVVLVTGLLQFPICAGIMFAIFTALQAAGWHFGAGDYATFYCGVTTAISSTVLVVKRLCEQADMDSAPGRLTVNILIFQDLWAILLLAFQPNLADPQPLKLLQTFALILGLVIIALLYAKFVIPAVLLVASKSVELMLIVALAWCFFVCAFATLPFIGLTAELAALISGVALATFPYSTEFNGKIKYIRDFFITLFLAYMGVKIGVPSLSTFGTAVVVALVVMAVRWIGIFCIVLLMGGGGRSAGLSTINLMQISEIALVICSLGTKDPYVHIDEETLKIIAWSFALLFAITNYVIRYNYRIYGFLAHSFMKVTGKELQRRPTYETGKDDGASHADRDIVLLGFHKVAAMLVSHFEHNNPQLLEKLHVIDFNSEWMRELRKRGVTCSFGDISDAKVLRTAFSGEPRLVISSVPDSHLTGICNEDILMTAKSVWPEAHIIVTAENPMEAHRLYLEGADYVIRMAKLAAEKLSTVIKEHCSHLVHRAHMGNEIAEQVFDYHRNQDKAVDIGSKTISPDIA